MAGFLEVGQFHGFSPLVEDQVCRSGAGASGRADVRFPACRSRSRFPRRWRLGHRVGAGQAFLADGVENGIGADIQADADFSARIAAGARRAAGEQPKRIGVLAARIARRPRRGRRRPGQRATKNAPSISPSLTRDAAKASALLRRAWREIRASAPRPNRIWRAKTSQSATFSAPASSSASLPHIRAQGPIVAGEILGLFARQGESIPGGVESLDRDRRRLAFRLAGNGIDDRRHQHVHARIGRELVGPVDGRENAAAPCRSVICARKNTEPRALLRARPVRRFRRRAAPRPSDSVRRKARRYAATGFARGRCGSWCATGRACGRC